jgi:hypothetical protein
MTKTIDPADWPDELRPVVECMNELLEVPSGRRRYDAAAIKREPCIAALDLLRGLEDGPVPLPRVVPTAQGGIELHWDGENGDVVLDFDPAKPEEFGFVVAVEAWRGAPACVPLARMLSWIDLGEEGA